MSLVRTDDTNAIIDYLFASQELIADEHKRYCLEHPDEYLEMLGKAASENTNGPLLGILLSSAFVGISGGTWLAIGLSLVSGLVQWWLAPQPPAQRQPDAVFQPTYGNESLGGFARFGQTIPAVWCSRTLDPTGGVVVGGDLVHSRIETIEGNQITYARFIVSHGEIGAIDLTQTTVNEQPIQQFSDRDIKQSWQSGKINQLPLADYPFYSQNLPVSVNATCGAGLVSKQVSGGSDKIGVTNIANFSKTYNIGLGLTGQRWYRLNVVPERFFTIASVDTANSTITTNQDMRPYLAIGQTVQFSTPAGGIAGSITSLPVATSSVFIVPANEFESYSGGVKYLAANQSTSSQGEIYTPFRILEKIKTVTNNVAYYSLTSDTILPPGNSTVYSYNIIQYQTTKRVDRLDLNFQAQVWARNPEGSLIDFVQAYSVWIKPVGTAALQRVCYFYIRSSNPGTLLRSLKLADMALNSYQVEVRPELLNNQTSFGSFPVIVLRGEGAFVDVPFTGGSIQCQGSINAESIAALVSLSDQSKERAPDNSAQRGSTLVLQHVNEIQQRDSSNNIVDCSYKGYATVEVSIRASEVVGRSQNFAFFITEGIIVNKLEYLVNSLDSLATVLYTGSPIGVDTAIDKWYVRNLDKRKQGLVVASTSYSLTTLENLDWEYGDRALVFRRGSTCWWPEIYADLSSEAKYGASDALVSDYYLDYKQLINNAQWVSGDNEHNSIFAWHGAITAATELAVLNNNNCKKVMLLPSRTDGKAGFFEQKTPPIKAFYNSANSSDVRVEYVSAIRNKVNTIVVVYREQEAYYDNASRLKFSPRSITIQTVEAYNQQVAEVRNVVQLAECTSRLQAIKTGQIMLNIVRYGSKIAATLKGSTIESLNLAVGSLFDLRTSDMVITQEYCGVVVEVGLDGLFRLDKELVISAGIAAGSNPTGLSDNTADYIQAGVAIGDIVRRLDNSAHSVISAVGRSSLDCVPLIPDQAEYEIIDNTLSTLKLRTVTEDDRYLVESVESIINPLDNIQWLRASREPPMVGDSVGIGLEVEQRRVFQCLAVSPTIGQADANGRAVVECPIIGANWDDRFFDYRDTVIIDRTGVIIL